MAESVDATDLKSVSRKGVGVQVPLSVPDRPPRREKQMDYSGVYKLFKRYSRVIQLLRSDKSALIVWPVTGQSIWTFLLRYHPEIGP